MVRNKYLDKKSSIIFFLLMSCNTAFSEWYWGVTTGAITGVLIPWYMEQSCYKGIEYGALACSITATVALTRLTSSQKNYRNNCLDAMGLDCVTGLLGGTIRSFLQAKRRGVSLPWACFLVQKKR